MARLRHPSLEQRELAARVERAAREAGYNTEKHGWQTKLATDAGVGQTVLNKLLRAQTMPQLKTLDLLARRLGVRLAWLMLGEPPERTQESAIFSVVPKQKQ